LGKKKRTLCLRRFRLALRVHELRKLGKRLRVRDSGGRRRDSVSGRGELQRGGNKRFIKLFEKNFVSEKGAEGAINILLRSLGRLQETQLEPKSLGIIRKKKTAKDPLQKEIRGGNGCVWERKVDQHTFPASEGSKLYSEQRNTMKEALEARRQMDREKTRFGRCGRGKNHGGIRGGKINHSGANWRDRPLEVTFG